MPTGLTHAVVGFGLAEALLGPTRPPLFYGLATLLAVLPDLDIIGIFGDVPHDSFFGHRGF